MHYICPSSSNLVRLVQWSPATGSCQTVWMDNSCPTLSCAFSRRATIPSPNYPETAQFPSVLGSLFPLESKELSWPAFSPGCWPQVSEIKSGPRVSARASHPPNDRPATGDLHHFRSVSNTSLATCVYFIFRKRVQVQVPEHIVDGFSRSWTARFTRYQGRWRTHCPLSKKLNSLSHSLLTYLGFSMKKHTYHFNLLVSHSRWWPIGNLITQWGLPMQVNFQESCGLPSALLTSYHVILS